MDSSHRTNEGLRSSGRETYMVAHLDPSSLAFQASIPRLSMTLPCSFGRVTSFIGMFMDHHSDGIRLSL